jgi:pimeloyl-ACP methyl ester carboxylesterase
MTETTLNALPMFKSDAGKTRYLAAYDAVLQDWPVPYEEIDLPTRLGSTHVIASGAPDAPALVLLPSFCGSATVWRPNVAELSHHYRTYAVDVIGQAGKSVATKRVRNRREFAGWFSDLLDGLGVERTSIVGCSFGGFLALNQASLTPERIERVVLISPAGTFVALSWKFTYTMLVLGRLKRLMRRLQRNKRAPEIADLLDKDVRLHPSDAKWRALMSVTMSDFGPANVINATVFSDAELRAIRAPTLLLIGDKERLYEPHATLKLALKCMPGLEGAIVPEADHIAAMAQPDDVNERIIRFLQRAGRTGKRLGVMPGYRQRREPEWTAIATAGSSEEA